MQRLIADYKQIQSEANDLFTVELVDDTNLTHWKVTIFGPADTIYEGHLLEGRMEFPDNYPWSPPRFKFTTPLWHPNIYWNDSNQLNQSNPSNHSNHSNHSNQSSNGLVCISILHEGDDVSGYESRSERWSPVMTSQMVIQSIISLLDNPNPESPANIEAAKMMIESDMA